jgi:hypothetical protein
MLMKNTSSCFPVTSVSAISGCGMKLVNFNPSRISPATLSRTPGGNVWSATDDSRSSSKAVLFVTGVPAPTWTTPRSYRFKERPDGAALPQRWRIGKHLAGVLRGSGRSAEQQHNRWQEGAILENHDASKTRQTGLTQNAPISRTEPEDGIQV